MNEHFFIYNGFLFKNGRPILSGGHPVILYGDGIFETIRFYQGKMVHSDLHKQRLLQSMQTLGYQPEKNFIRSVGENVGVLLGKNQLLEHARIRLTVMRASNFFRENDSRIDYVIEATSVALPEFLTSGLRATVYSSSKKGTGILSNIKTNNFLLNVQAIKFARENDADEAILLNAFDRICEASVGNIFFVENGKIFTPSLSEGCVAGVMREWLLTHLPEANFSVEQTECPLSRLMNADEIFMTNAIRWIQPIASIGEKKFKNGLAEKLFYFVKEKVEME